MSYTQSHQYSAQRAQKVPDGVLIGRAQAGDQRAFEFLVNRYHHPLANYIRVIVKDREMVSDVLQHVYFKLYVSLPILLTNGSLKGWLFQVARNRCLDELRNRHQKVEISFSYLEWKHCEEDLSPIETIPDPEPLPEEVAERMDLSFSLQEAIAALPPKFRSIVCLHCFRQLSFSEIASLLNMPASTVKTYFYRSLPRLRRALTSSRPFTAVS